ncbi:hypothetical protein AAFC00_005534 [Neodothiora populina]|uniref:Sulphur transport domain-containing protein n=1 Tax=Neodothiora populina TaxID=2781224 RepID=A0ABR3PL74_9PEZI
MAEFEAGAAFGAALFASGVYSPDVILTQFNLTNFHMLKSFVTASGVSAIVLHVANQTHYATLKVREPRNLGFFPYDGNVIGGAMIGAGMVLTGACPGTVLVQAGTGRGTFTLIGAVVGGLGYVLALPYLQHTKPARTQSLRKSHEKQSDATVLLATSTSSREPTITATLEANPLTMVVAWEATCMAILYIASSLDPHKSQPQLAGLISPITGGLAIGAAQGVSILLNKHSVGCSGVYQNIGRYLQRTFRSSIFDPQATSQLLAPATVFALGITSASVVLSHHFPPPASATPGTVVEPVKAILGGTIMAFGAGIAGGCTSGHGISGLATFSLSSFVSVAAMFSSGMVAALVF